MPFIKYLKNSKLFIYLLINKRLDLLLKPYYSVSIIFLKLLLRKKCKGLYIKGSYGKKFFSYGISDIDLVLVGELNQFEKVKSIIKKVNLIFPFINDIDCYEAVQFENILKFSDLRYKDFRNWYIVLEDKYEISDHIEYIYFPLKYKIDQYYQLFFQLEWLYKNLKISTLYANINTLRILKKINQILSWIEVTSFEEYPTFDVESLSLDETLERISNSHFIDDFKTLLERTNIKETSFYEKRHDYIVVADRKVSLENKHQSNFDMTIPENLFSVFLRLGFIGLDTLVINASKQKPGAIKMALWMRIYGENLVSGKSILVDYQDEYNLIKMLLAKSQLSFIGQPNEAFSKNIFITVSWGEDLLRRSAFKLAQEELRKQRGEFSRVHVNLNSDFDEDGLSYLNLKMQNFEPELWHKEALYNFAAQFFFFTENFIFCDADVSTSDSDWIDHSFKEIDSSGNTFFQCFSEVEDSVIEDYRYISWIKSHLDGKKPFYAPGLVWGIKSQLLNRINYFPDMLIDGSNDGLLLEELSGERNGDCSNFTWYKGHLRKNFQSVVLSFIDKKLIHHNHGPIKNYINRAQYLDYANFDFLDAYTKNLIGFYEVINKDLFNIICNLKYERLDLLNDSRFLDNKKTKFYLRENGYIQSDGIIFVSEDDKGLKIQNISNRLLSVTVVPFIKEIYREEVFRLKFKINHAKIIDGFIVIDGYQDNSICILENEQNELQTSFSSWQDTNFYMKLNIEIEQSESAYIKFLDIESIHSVHAWDSYDYKILKISELNNILNLEKMTQGWYRLNLKAVFDESVKYFIRVLNFEMKSICIERSYNSSEKLSVYIFYYDESFKQLWLSFTLSDRSLGRIEMEILKRKDLSQMRINKRINN